MTTAPVTHLEESLKLSADAIIALWQANLKGVSTVLFFRDGPTITWQGNTYESMACSIAGEIASSDGQASRPMFTVINPENIFAPFASAGYFDLATDDPPRGDAGRPDGQRQRLPAVGVDRRASDQRRGVWSWSSSCGHR